VPPLEAAIEACRLRLRPILMTSIAFIAGVFPLVVAHGAGAEMRQAMGIAVFSGMIGVTLFGLFLTPVFYVTLMKLGRKKKAPVASTPAASGRARPRRSRVGLLSWLAVHLGFQPGRSADGGAGLSSPVQCHSRPLQIPATPATGRNGRPLDNVPKGNWWDPVW
jgi:hypothetical protein